MRLYGWLYDKWHLLIFKIKSTLLSWTKVHSVTFCFFVCIAGADLQIVSWENLQLCLWHIFTIFFPKIPCYRFWCQCYGSLIILAGVLRFLFSEITCVRLCLNVRELHQWSHLGINGVFFLKRFLTCDFISLRSTFIHFSCVFHAVFLNCAFSINLSISSYLFNIMA